MSFETINVILKIDQRLLKTDDIINGGLSSALFTVSLVLNTCTSGHGNAFQHYCVVNSSVGIENIVIVLLNVVDGIIAAAELSQCCLGHKAYIDCYVTLKTANLSIGCLI